MSQDCRATTTKINPCDGTVVMDGGILKYVNVPYDKLIPFLRELRQFLVELGVHPNWATIYTVSVITNEFMECVARGDSVFAEGPFVSDLQEFLAKHLDPKSSQSEQQKQS